MITISFAMASIMGAAQTLASFEIDLSKATNGIDVPVSISLAELKISSTTLFSLAEVIDNKKVSVPFR
ncbi:MAG: hypothetical protein WDO16_03015 [Bacteroidota bacterium]